MLMQEKKTLALKIHQYATFKKMITVIMFKLKSKCQASSLDNTRCQANCDSSVIATLIRTPEWVVHTATKNYALLNAHTLTALPISVLPASSTSNIKPHITLVSMLSVKGTTLP